MTQIMTCGCAPMADHEGHPSCPVHDCCEMMDTPNLEGRKARCSYYGKRARQTYEYNGNCCSKCRGGEPCQCERDSSTSLWFFQSHPDKEFDEFYCACMGAD